MALIMKPTERTVHWQGTAELLDPNGIVVAEVAAELWKLSLEVRGARWGGELTGPSGGRPTLGGRRATERATPQRRPIGAHRLPWRREDGYRRARSDARCPTNREGRSAVLIPLTSRPWRAGGCPVTGAMRGRRGN